MSETKETHSKAKEPSSLHVCVIGAGVCGLVSVKACLEAGFRVTCYERSSKYGGLWCYRPDDKQKDSSGAEPSVMRTTILNTSKELSAFSDMPPPAKLANFMRHSHYMDYINSYVARNKLLGHVKLEHEIVHCKPEWSATNEESQGWQEGARAIKWLVSVRDLRANRDFTERFDRLMVAIGHHNVPYMPSFTGQHKFKGDIIHSARVKDILTDERFINKRVLIVGLGNSACDAASDLSMVTEKCYVSCHRGTWFISRLTSRGLYDFELKSRWKNYLSKVAPTKLIDRFVINSLEERTNHRLLGLKPRHKPSEQVPAINDLFPYRILTGGLVLKGSVSTFTERGVVFEGEEDQEYQVDVVVLATGYVARVPFLNEFELGLKSSEHNEYELYLNMFAPRLTITGLLDQPTPMEALASLAFIGLVQPSGSITVVSELQARYAALIFSGQLELPSVGKMLRHIEQVRRARNKAIRSHSRDQLVGNWIGYLDLIAKQMGVRPNFWRMFFTDYALWKQLTFGPSVPYQYRLTGPGNWPRARETILAVPERVYQGINEGKNHILFKSRRKCLNSEPAKEQQPASNNNCSTK